MPNLPPQWSNLSLAAGCSRRPLREATLRINCAKGNAPEEEQSDGVQLTTISGPTFDEQVSARTVFLLQRPMLNLTEKKESSNGSQ